MSENILRALMRLFALISKVEDEATMQKGLGVVKDYLAQQLNTEQVARYLELYKEFLVSHHKLNDTSKASKRVSLNSVKVLRICTEINGELLQRQKVIVLIRLIEFINSDNTASDQELEFVQSVAQSFNIPDEEYRRLMHFINAGSADADAIGELLVISGIKKALTGGKILHADGLEGEIMVIPVPSVQLYVCRYMGSSEIYLNGQVISDDKLHILTQGSIIRGSKMSPVFYSEIISQYMQEHREKTIVFEAKDLEYHFKSGKKGLHTLRFTEESGTLVGIMGGSGAGKSTVLNVLNGNEVPSSGKVTINGIDIHHEKHRIEGVIGYVSQDDLLIDELTVYQNLFYNAKLCFGQYDDEKISKLVMDLLLSLGLQDTAQLKVGSPLDKTISGGQRKRLNIGLELIREPAVLFVDEPTSGLSSRDSENIMDLLKELSQKGKLVFVVIHQPSSDIFKMFDKLLILDLGGYPIYYGNPVESLIYFKKRVNHVNAGESECIHCGNVNPEQVFNIIETRVVDEYGNQTVNRKVSPSEWNQEYIKYLKPSSDKQKPYTEIPESTFKIPNPFRQFIIFVTRDVLSKLTNVQYLAINTLETPLLAIILAWLVKFFITEGSAKSDYHFFENENIPAYILMGVVIALFVGLTVSAEEIFKDRKILKRESFLNLSRTSYLWSKIAILFSLSAVQTLMFVLLGNTILGINGMYFDYWLMLFSISCFANMLGLNISASFNSAVTIYILIPFLIIPQLILSGVIVKFDKLHPKITSQSKVPVVGDLMASRWAYEALAVNQFKNNAFEKPLYEFDRLKSEAEWRKTYWVVEMKQIMDGIGDNLERTEPEIQQKVKDDIAIIRTELEAHNKICPLAFTQTEKLNPENFNKQTAESVNAYLDNISGFYKRKYNFVSKKKDAYVYSLTSTSASRETYEILRDENENENLSMLVTQKNVLDKKIIQTEGRLVQKADPVFNNPPADSFLRAHFFAPTKSIFGNRFDTYWVNFSVIWFMSLALLITLYFDAFKKLLDLFGKISINKMFKKAKK
jgi:ABC-type multidrug transport system ATPase subunit